MKRLIDRMKNPPGGFRFVDPDNGYKYPRVESMDKLLVHIKTYRAQNKLEPIQRLTTMVECWLCDQPGMESYCIDVGGPRTFQQYLEGARAGAQIALNRVGMMMGLSRSPFTSQTVAEKRAATCVRCRYNVQNEKDSKARRYTDEFVASLVGARHTSEDGKLFSCSVCSCPLRPKVHVSDKIIQERMNANERYRFPNGEPGKDGKPLYCWQVRPITEDEANGEDHN
jgi:hypothetical protein